MPEDVVSGPEAALEIITRKLYDHPRSAQREIGPSEIGHPCPRWLAYRLAGLKHNGNEGGDSSISAIPPWRQQVGTLVHAAFSEWLVEADEISGKAEWLTDLKVTIGEISPGRFISGHLDAYHIPSATVVDLKVPGPAAMKRYRNGPENPQYRTQIHSYARGAVNAGLEVRKVATLRVPSAGELADAIIKEEPYDERIALEGLKRAGILAGLVKDHGLTVIGQLPPVEHFCHRCDFFKPNSTDFNRGCPGAPRNYMADPSAGGLIDV